MQRISSQLYSLLLALLLTAAILFGSIWMAEEIRSSGVYNKSRLMSRILSQEEISFSDMLGDRHNVGMMLKFVGALTSAYIDFELIPVHELDTFTAVMGSVNDGIAIDRFAYHRKNLTIYGQAADREQMRQFLSALQETDQFKSIAQHAYETTADTMRFEMVCVSRL